MRIDRNVITIAGVFALCGHLSAAAPLSIDFVPVSQTVSSGPILLDVQVSGFATAGVNATGDFGFSVSFDPAILTATDITFGPYLGDPGNFEALFTEDFSTPGLFVFNEVSLLAPPDLIALQGPVLSPGFVLATLSFDPAGIGTSPLDFVAAIAGDENGADIPLTTGSASVTVVPEPATAGIAILALALIVCAPSRRRALMWCGPLVFVGTVCAALGPKIPLKDSDGKDTGIQYQVGTTQLVPSNPKDPKNFAKNLLTPITIFNTTADDQRVVMCLTGYSAPLDTSFTNMLVQMSLGQDNNFTCSIPNAQTLKARADRLGSMGCRLLTIKAGKSADASFVSGNDRTIPQFDGMKKPVEGKFKMVGTFGGVGPTQTGAVGSGIAAGDGWGNVGGHPGFTSSDITATGKVGKITDALDTLGIHLILLQDPKLGFVADPAPPPARDQATFNCNKCFGMAGASGATSFGQYGGYSLAPLAKADRKGVKAVFANHWVKYNSLKLDKSEVLTASLNLYSDDTFFADAPSLVSYSLAANMPSGCMLQNPSVPPNTVFSVSPQEAKTMTIEVSCDSTLVVGSAGDLTLTLTSADPDNPGIVGQEFARLVSPLPCDFNADGSIDSIDIADLLSRVGQMGGPGNPYDVDHDGLITPNDARICTLQCSLPTCAIPVIQ
jgi:hypothetical protein